MLLTIQGDGSRQMRTLITAVIKAVTGNPQGLTRSRTEHGLARVVRMDFPEEVTFQCAQATWR